MMRTHDVRPQLDDLYLQLNHAWLAYEQAETDVAHMEEVRCSWADKIEEIEEEIETLKVWL